MIDFADWFVQTLNGDMGNLLGVDVLGINERRDSAFAREDRRRCVVGRLSVVSGLAC